MECLDPVKNASFFTFFKTKSEFAMVFVMVTGYIFYAGGGLATYSIQVLRWFPLKFQISRGQNCWEFGC
jgi:hypothetical protein